MIFIYSPIDTTHDAMILTTGNRYGHPSHSLHLSRSFTKVECWSQAKTTYFFGYLRTGSIGNARATEFLNTRLIVIIFLVTSRRRVRSAIVPSLIVIVYVSINGVGSPSPNVAFGIHGGCMISASRCRNKISIGHEWPGTQFRRLIIETELIHWIAAPSVQLALRGDRKRRVTSGRDRSHIVFSGEWIRGHDQILVIEL